MNKVALVQALREAYSHALAQGNEGTAALLDNGIKELSCKDPYDLALWALEKLDRGDTLELEERLAVRRVVTEGVELVRAFTMITGELVDG